MVTTPTKVRLRSRGWLPAHVLMAMAAIGLTAGDQPGKSGAQTVDTTRRSSLLPLGVLNELGEYQQVFDSDTFSGPVRITEIAFATALGHGTPSHTWHGLEIALSTTTADPADPNLNMPFNRGRDYKVVYRADSQSFKARGDGSFDLVFPITPFVYDPDRGNLLVEVVVDSHAGRLPLYFTAGNAPGIGNVYRLPNSKIVIRNRFQGLLTRFALEPVQRTAKGQFVARTTPDAPGPGLATIPGAASR